MKKLRVLIVEDDPVIALDLEWTLSKLVKADVFVSPSVAVAKAIIDKSVYFALLDVNVTNGETYEVAERLRAQSVPCLFLTASEPADIPEHLRDVPFIPKPHDERQLLRTLQEMLPAR